jgi:GTPase SAR1 family protein
MEGGIILKISKGKIQSAKRVIIYGPEGVGKSTFASKFPDPLFIDVEGGTNHLDVSRFDRPTSWEMLLAQVKYVKDSSRKGDTICKTLIIDTIDWAETLCMEHICAKHNKNGIEHWEYGKGYVYMAEELGKRLFNQLNDLIEIGINVVLVAHSAIRKFEQPDEMGAYDRWEMKLHRRTLALCKEWADMILFANYKTLVIRTDDGKVKARGGQRVMYTSHHVSWDAKNRMDLPEELPFEFDGIAYCFTAKADDIKPSTIVDSTSPVTTEKLPTAEPAITAPAATEPSFLVQEELQLPPKESFEEIVTKGHLPPPEPMPHVSTLPKALRDLMKENNVGEREIQEVVAQKGYYPADMSIKHYDADFINGVLVGAWPQVLEMIKENVPF